MAPVPVPVVIVLLSALEGGGFNTPPLSAVPVAGGAVPPGPVTVLFCANANELDIASTAAKPMVANFMLMSFS